MIDPKEDDLSYFADWYLNSGDIKRIYTPFKNPLLFIEGVSGIVLYRKNNFQVELFICEPNTIIPEHTHPDVDSYELFLYGMKFTHSGEEVITNKQSEEEMEGMPSYAYETIRVNLESSCGEKRNVEYVFKNAHLLSQNLNTDADNNTKVELRYSTVSRYKPDIFYT